MNAACAVSACSARSASASVQEARVEKSWLWRSRHVRKAHSALFPKTCAATFQPGDAADDGRTCSFHAVRSYGYGYMRCQVRMCAYT